MIYHTETVSRRAVCRVSWKGMDAVLRCVLPLLLLARCCPAQDPPAPASKYADPARFEQQIQEFETQDAKSPPPTGAVLCVGSSTMRMWHGMIHEDLAPLTVVARGFGGSTMHDLLHFSDRIVIPYRPRAILVYEGDNDIAQGVGPQEIFATWRAFVERVWEHLPETRIYFMAIKPSESRWKLWPQAEEVNRLVAEHCARDPRLTYLDITTALLNRDGQVRGELFLEDRLHLNRAGYTALRDVIQPVLVEQQLAGEPKEKAAAP
jgi:lysophospholipase L1-like esterase